MRYKNKSKNLTLSETIMVYSEVHGCFCSYEKLVKLLKNP